MPVDVAGFVSVLIPKALAASVAAQSVDMQQHLGSPRQDSADKYLSTKAKSVHHAGELKLAVLILDPNTTTVKHATIS